MTVAAILCVYLMARDRHRFVENFQKIGLSGIVGAWAWWGVHLFIWSITLTTAANTLFLFSTIPFIAAFLGIVLLKETLRPITWVSMGIAFVGIGVMVVEGLEAGSLLGIVTGFASACGFATFSISLRMRKETPQFATVALAGILCAVITAVIMQLQNDAMTMPLRNILLSMVHGSLVGSGLILFSIGAGYFPAAELNLLSLFEVVGGVGLGLSAHLRHP